MLVADFPLLDAIAPAALRKLSQFESPALSGIAWAIDARKIKDVPLLDAISPSSLRKISADGSQAQTALADVFLAFRTSWGLWHEWQTLSRYARTLAWQLA